MQVEGSIVSPSSSELRDSLMMINFRRVGMREAVQYSDLAITHSSQPFFLLLFSPEFRRGWADQGDARVATCICKCKCRSTVSCPNSRCRFRNAACRSMVNFSSCSNSFYLLSSGARPAWPRRRRRWSIRARAEP